MAIEEILFYVLAGLTVLSALLMVTSRNPIHSILYLIITFFCISGHYILLNAQFLAVVNIIVYAGAIMVLFLFVVMLMNLNSEKKSFGTPAKLAVAGVVCLVFIILTISILTTNGKPTTAVEMGTGEIGLIHNLGMLLYSDYVLPFELSSILFISAMIGAVILSKKDKELID
ncbi:NADH-quinone oxidoreductase subunit J [Vaginella massiliensis]|uniref:NADH-quinone oxidoreductase subunit J family protein n=1 Tax=Vaginella massiliensis TaxID=1816680 RepID=UPI000838FA62|nr:NADH-quinone oxidoreductase subunit J [Vaginella massiliensis]